MTEPPIAELVRCWRAENKLSLAQAGELLGVAHTTVRDWERGRTPRDVHLARFSTQLAQSGPSSPVSRPLPTLAAPTPLRMARIERGWTMRQLARRAHVCLHLLSIWERGIRRPGREHHPALSRALGMPVDKVAALFDPYPESAAAGERLPSLRQLRLDALVSQRALAEAAGVSVTTMAAWERGVARVPRGRLDIISRTVNLSVAELIARGCVPRHYARRQFSALAQLRRQAGLTQVRAAQRLNMSARQLARIESGTRRPSTMLCHHLATLYGVPFRQVASAARLERHPLHTRDQWPQAPLGEILRFLRTEADLTVERTATELGVRAATLRNWESGRTSPASRYRLRFVELFGLAHHELPPDPRQVGGSA